MVWCCLPRAAQYQAARMRNSSSSSSARPTARKMHGRPLLLLLLLLLLALLLLIGSGCRASTLPPSSSLALPAEAPALLVFTQADLAACLSTAAASRSMRRTCVLSAAVTLNAAWRGLFADSGGVAVLPEHVTVTITATCNTSAAGGCAFTNSSGRSPVPVALDLGALPSVLLLSPHSTLRLQNLSLRGLATREQYAYTPSQPYGALGVGTGLWPTLGFAPGSAVSVGNTSVTFANPSRQESCEDYTAKSVFSFQQLYSPRVVSLDPDSRATGRISSLNISVPIINGSTKQRLGNSTSTYVGVTFSCVERVDDQQQGASKGLPPLAVVVPVAVVAAAAALAGLWLLRRRRQRRRAHAQAAALAPGSKGPPLLPPGVPPASDAAMDAAGGARDLERGWQQLQVWSPPPAPDDSWHEEGQALDAPPSSSPADAPTRDPKQAAAADTVSALPGRTRRRSLDSSSLASMQHSVETLAEEGAAGRSEQRSSAEQCASSDTGDINCTPQSSLEQPGALSIGTDVTGSKAAGERHSSAAALLKARSDLAVLRDLKIGPLLGRGSYGRVYRGRWKTTTVAVKIIEHPASGGAASSSGARVLSAGRESLFATSVSHPNLVTTYHISTMTMAQRSELASKWLAEAAATAGAGSSAAAVGASSSSGRPPSSGVGGERTDSSPLSSDEDDEDDAELPQLLETWIIMEFCERGSLEHAIKQGKFRGRSGADGGLPDMASILRVLLDTAAGLDYLHSIGVVHGDLKGANVLLKGSAKDARSVTCKITDFGLSRVLDMDATHISTGTYGTIVYMPKELLLSGRMTQAADIYSFGLLMWELFTGQSVMDEGLTLGQMFFQIAYQGWRPALPGNCPHGYAELMTSCWAEDPELRPSAQHLLKRLQRLHVQAKQQAAAERAGRPDAAERALAAPVTAPLTDSPGSFGLPDGSPAYAGATSPSLPSEACTPARTSLEEHGPPAAQQPRAQPASSAAAAPLSAASSTGLQAGLATLRSSVDISSGSMDSSFLPPSRATRMHNADSGRMLEREYQSFAEAVLDRAASLSTAAGRPGSQAAPTAALAHPSTSQQPVSATWPAVLDAPALRHEQQQVLQGFALHVPQTISQQAASLSRLPSVREVQSGNDDDDTNTDDAGGGSGAQTAAAGWPGPDAAQPADAQLMAGAGGLPNGTSVAVDSSAPSGESWSQDAALASHSLQLTEPLTSLAARHSAASAEPAEAYHAAAVRLAPMPAFLLEPSSPLASEDLARHAGAIAFVAALDRHVAARPRDVAGAVSSAGAAGLFELSSESPAMSVTVSAPAAYAAAVEPEGEQRGGGGGSLTMDSGHPQADGGEPSELARVADAMGSSRGRVSPFAAWSYGNGHSDGGG